MSLILEEGLNVKIRTKEDIHRITKKKYGYSTYNDFYLENIEGKKCKVIFTTKWENKSVVFVELENKEKILIMDYFIEGVE